MHRRYLERIAAIVLMISSMPGPCVFAQQEPPLPEGLKAKEKPRQEEPPLPAGLGREPKAEEPALPAGPAPEGKQTAEEPGLPAGLVPAKEKPSGEPALPVGLEKKVEPAKPAKKPAEEWRLPFDLTGFWEIRGGMRTRRDRYESDVSIGETRLQLEAEKQLGGLTLNVTTDWIYDPVFNHHDLYLEDGRGFLDLRQANAAFSPLSFMDLKVGRQILTWGTGDLLFLNDLFPKDWNAFFIGRDVEYLKAPSDALKASLFSGIANVDVVYTPRFDADRYIDGRRISYFNPVLGHVAGKNAVIDANRPDDWFEDYELAWRISRQIGSYELAGYGYYGFWKNPAGMDPTTGQATFPDLSAYGGSVRGTVWKGIGNIEFSYYDSRQDRHGRDPFIRNSEFRGLVGYEQEIGHDFTLGLQYYLEYMMDYGAYRRNLPPGAKRAAVDRHLLTIRLTKLLMNQNLELSMFAFYSPSDHDAYLRPGVHYKISDAWAAEVGGNVFLGTRDYTFFGQFKDDSNVYVGLRWSF